MGIVPKTVQVKEKNRLLFPFQLASATVLCCNSQLLRSIAKIRDKNSILLELCQTMQHLHRIIDKNRLDHVTVPTGRPYVLVCNKATASFAAAEEVYRRDCANLKSTETLLTQ